MKLILNYNLAHDSFGCTVSWLHIGDSPVKMRKKRCSTAGAGKGGVKQEMEREEEKGSIYLVRVGPVPSSSTKMKSGSLSFSPFSSHPLPIPLSSTPLSPVPILLCRRFWSPRRGGSSPILKRRPLDICTRPAPESENSTVALPSSTFLCFIRFQAPLKRKFPPRWRRFIKRKARGSFHLRVVSGHEDGLGLKVSRARKVFSNFLSAVESWFFRWFFRSFFFLFFFMDQMSKKLSFINRIHGRFRSVDDRDEIKTSWHNSCNSSRHYFRVIAIRLSIEGQSGNVQLSYNRVGYALVLPNKTY